VRYTRHREGEGERGVYDSLFSNTGTYNDAQAGLAGEVVVLHGELILLLAGLPERVDA
jgi:hypothetical protein